ncbi:hypothetical protein E3N88_12191 [Mikania micrantha]|uniref:Uncharacterized protein n=1 Tax=Mikania micrantha TaxID=192012 RepID=A0A5N6P543_9ASTR|nr:hypothetical protein E3N88_12191 [Mikania micrantha]
MERSLKTAFWKQKTFLERLNCLLTCGSKTWEIYETLTGTHGAVSTLGLGKGLFQPSLSSWLHPNLPHSLLNSSWVNVAFSMDKLKEEVDDFVDFTMTYQVGQLQCWWVTSCSTPPGGLSLQLGYSSGAEDEGNGLLWLLLLQLRVSRKGADVVPKWERKKERKD